MSNVPCLDYSTSRDSQNRGSSKPLLINITTINTCFVAISNPYGFCKNTNPIIVTSNSLIPWSQLCLVLTSTMVAGVYALGGLEVTSAIECWILTIILGYITIPLYYIFYYITQYDYLSILPYYHITRSVSKLLCCHTTSHTVDGCEILQQLGTIRYLWNTGSEIWNHRMFTIYYS